MKKMMMLVLVALMTMGVFAGCATEKPVTEEPAAELSGYQALVERGYVIVGLDDTFAPLGFRTTDGELIGFDVDLAKEVFARLELEVQFQPIDWSMKETELNSGNIDMIWNGYTITPEREEKVAFSTPYLKNRQVIVVLPESGISTKADLAGKNVACQSESSAYAAITADEVFTAALDGGAPIAFDTNNEAFMDLEAGRVNALVADEIMAMYYIGEKGVENYLVLDEDFGKEEYGVGFRKGDTELVQKVNETLDAMKEDGAAAKVSTVYFGTDIVSK
jgi:polar amino acid transport system substrate-binding protein